MLGHSLRGSHGGACPLGSSRRRGIPYMCYLPLKAGWGFHLTGDEPAGLDCPFPWP